MTQNMVVPLNSTNFPEQLGPLLRLLPDICHHGFVTYKCCLETHRSELVG